MILGRLVFIVSLTESRLTWKGNSVRDCLDPVVQWVCLCGGGYLDYVNWSEKTCLLWVATFHNLRVPELNKKKKASSTLVSTNPLFWSLDCECHVSSSLKFLLLPHLWHDGLLLGTAIQIKPFSHELLLSEHFYHCNRKGKFDRSILEQSLRGVVKLSCG